MISPIYYRYTASAGFPPPGTPFGESPDDRACPVSGVAKSNFEEFAGKRDADPRTSTRWTRRW
ncbi:rubredoxin [Proteus mirabilis]|nr:rubredoxin [Proteus mirabilis]